MHRSRLSFKLVASAYFGALFAMGIIMHFIASVITAALYFSPVLPLLPKIDPTWYAPVYGTTGQLAGSEEVRPAHPKMTSG